MQHLWLGSNVHMTLTRIPTTFIIVPKRCNEFWKDVIEVGLYLQRALYNISAQEPKALSLSVHGHNFLGQKPEKLVCTGTKKMLIPCCYFACIFAHNCRVWHYKQRFFCLPSIIVYHGYVGICDSRRTRLMETGLSHLGLSLFRGADEGQKSSSLSKYLLRQQEKNAA